MYRLGVNRSFIAQHHLIGGDWGSENDPHAHQYRVEVELEGSTLDEHEYLVDIVEVERAIEAIVGRFENRSLNDQPEFEGKNPSVERFARIFVERFLEQVQPTGLSAISVKMWEDDQAWASFRKAL